MVMQLPERDKLSMSYEQMMSRMAVLAGGRIAEELIFGKDKITSGASSDIEQATRLARAMVTRWGYSDALGAVAYGENQEEVFLGHSVARTQNVSEETARKIDSEVKRLVDHGFNEARRILTEKHDDLERMAQALLRYETLTGDEIQKVLRGEELPRADEVPPAPLPPTPALPVIDADGDGIPDHLRQPQGWGGAAPQGA
jgi:cell division protease FtsH